MKRKAVVLSSGGIDSTTCVAAAIEKCRKKNVSSVSVYYGQRHRIELDKAKLIAEYYGIDHYELDLTEIFKYNKTCSLLSQTNIEVEKSSYEEQLKKSDGKPVVTYVPFRNPLFIAAITSLAMSIYPNEKVDVYLGIHQDDSGAAYPDCSPQFNKAMAKAVRLGSGGLVRLVSPFVDCKKADIVKYGLEHNVPYEHTISCYDPDEYGRACGKCGTCIDRLKAFEANGAKDPIDYKE